MIIVLLTTGERIELPDGWADWSCDDTHIFFYKTGDAGEELTAYFETKYIIGYYYVEKKAEKE